MTESQDGWKDRLVDMEDWYRDLVDNGTAVQALVNDYSPYVSILGGLRGDVLDVGGGAGLAAPYLTQARSYVVVDPSESWQAAEWGSIRAQMGSSALVPQFHQGVGEALPFGAARFDAVVLFWSINHARDPKQVMQEVIRVVRPSGTVLVVLEDMIPTHRDMAMFTAATLFRRASRRKLSGDRWPNMGEGMRRVYRKRYFGSGWPLQPDHLRIDETDFLDWISPHLRVRRRWWASGFLSYLLDA